MAMQMSATVLLLVLVCHVQARGSGMTLDWAVQKPMDDGEDGVVVPESAGLDEMQAASMKEATAAPTAQHDESMDWFHENGLDPGGSGHAMQLSGPSVPTVTTQALDDRADADEADVVQAVSDDMAPGSEALTGIAQQLADQKATIEESKNSLELKSRDAKALIKEAYAKQHYIQQLQEKITQQAVTLEIQKQQVKEKEDQLAGLSAALKQQSASAENSVPSAENSVTSAIQAQLVDLEQKKREFEAEQAAKENSLKEMQQNLLKFKTSVEEKDSEVTKKEANVKKLLELNTPQKSSEKEDTKSHADALDAQVNLQLQKDLVDLPQDVRKELGPVEDHDTAVHAHIQTQPQLDVVRKPKIVAPANVISAAPKLELVDRTTRNVETRMDQRPPTYGQKSLAGQVYSAQFQPRSNGDQRDPDGKCRNSRGDVVACENYDSGAVPPVVPTIQNILDGDVYLPNLDGPCVLKCGYHKGMGRKIDYVNVEIPTQSSANLTIGCPKTNNGYPFVQCELMLDQSDQCRTTCVYDGDANPLKPNKLAFGQPVTGEHGFKFDPEEFKSFAHTTYQHVTSFGCGPRAGGTADPLVACEVKL